MATYSQLTELQKSTLEYLSNRLASIKRSDMSEKAKASQIGTIKLKVDEVYSAQETFDRCIRAANYFITRGEELKKEYGLTWKGEL